VSARPPEEQIPTAELPKAEVEEPEPERLTEAEIDLVTADTQPLPMELRHMVEESASRSARQEGVKREAETKMDEGQMESQTTEARNEVSEPRGDVGSIVGNIAGDTLLDLGSVGQGTAIETDEFVLDIDLDEVPDASAYQPSAYVRPPVYKSPVKDWKTSVVGSNAKVATADQFARTQEFPASVSEGANELKLETESSNAQPTAGAEAVGAGSQPVSLEGISPEVIEAIARRAVEHLSEKVVREIAWEVVPDLAELLIKRQLEEKNS
jgi:hypothetical protein